MKPSFSYGFPMVFPFQVTPRCFCEVFMRHALVLGEPQAFATDRLSLRSRGAWAASHGLSWEKPMGKWGFSLWYSENFLWKIHLEWGKRGQQNSGIGKWWVYGNSNYNDV